VPKNLPPPLYYIETPPYCIIWVRGSKYYWYSLLRLVSCMHIYAYWRYKSTWPLHNVTNANNTAYLSHRVPGWCRCNDNPVSCSQSTWYQRPNFLQLGVYRRSHCFLPWELHCLAVPNSSTELIYQNLILSGSHMILRGAYLNYI
jgi:hypothetical protein